MEITRTNDDGFSLQLKKSPVAEFDARFILSAGSRDRVKDTIDPAAYAPNLGKRLAALLGHGRTDVIGYWDKLKVEGDALIGDLKFVSTALGVMVKTWLDEGVPLFASIGFRGKGEPNDIGGVHYTALDLLETSIVTVPAHPRAQQIAKQFGFELPRNDGQLPAVARAAPSQSSAVAARNHSRGNTMQTQTISESIVATQAAQVIARDALAAATQAFAALDADDANFETQKTLVDELDGKLQKVDTKLATLKTAEASLMTGATNNASAAVILRRDAAKDCENLLGKLALCTFESRLKGMSVEQVAAQRFPNSTSVDTLIKAAVNPAMSNVPGYAQELTRMAYGQFMDLLRAEAILPSAVPPAQSHTFDGATSIYVPTRLGGPQDASAIFRAEGAPIPVKGLTFGHATLTPKNAGVILTATEEMVRRSSINLPAYFQSTMVKDTRTAFDGVFVGNAAATAISPGGARNGLAAGETRASTGPTAANIVNDLKVMLAALAAANMGGPSTRWIMHPSNFVAVSWLITATGVKQFPETASGNLGGHPVIQSATMPINIVLLIDFEQYTFAIGSPMFETTNVATVHEDNAPAPISTAGAPNVVAAPVRSFFQTNSWGVRMLIDADWVKLRTPGPVQELTAVAW